MAKKKDSTFELCIRCKECGSKSTKTGLHGIHCADCGNFDLDYSGDEVLPSGRRKPL
jgi:hypothetical protein